MRTFDVPKYKHDCESCRYLGRYTDTDEEYDLYVCPQSGMPTVIARFGDAGEEYTSGLIFALDNVLNRVDGNATTRVLGEALRRAVANGYAYLTLEMSKP